MAVPTFTSISPDEGHSGGVLVEIVGTNFRVAPEGERVRVRFEGGPNSQVEDATHVGVWDASTIRCFSPRLDPFEVDTPFTVDTGADTLIAAAHGLSDASLVQLVPSDTSSALPAPLSASQAYYVVNATAGDFQLATTPGGAAIDITSAGTGTFSAKTDGAYDVRITNLDDTDTPIPGEEVVASGVFRPVRPDLTSGGQLDAAIRAFILELRRQIIDNVTWTVHTDYDEETGNVEFAFPAKLPALVLAEIEIPENRQRGTTFTEDNNYNDPDTDGDFLCYRRGTLVDIMGTLLGVSDNPIELLNFAQATRSFFQKNDELVVPCPDSTTISYQMRAGQEMNISPLEGNTNVQWFTLPFKIVAVRIDEIPGLPKKTIPGAPTTGPTEAIIVAGKTAQIDPDTFDGLVFDVQPD